MTDHAAIAAEYQHGLNHNDWTLYDADGYITGRSVAVRYYPETKTQTSQVLIGATLHRADDLDIRCDQIESRLAGWYLAR